ncbi:hypothetical protein JCM3770_005353 [Rhodotorula araucariae]
MATPSRAASPSPSSTPSAAPSPVPQIPPHPSGAGALSPLYGSPRRSPGPYLQAGQGGLSRTRSPPAEHLPPNALPDSPALQSHLTDAQKADVIRRHLLTATEQQRVALDQALASSSSSPGRTPTPAGAAFPQASPTTATGDGHGPAGDDEFPTPYHLEGGDVVAGVYKWAAQQQQQDAAASGSGTTPDTAGPAPSLRRSRSLASVRAAGDPAPSRRVSLAGGGGPGAAAAADGRAAFRAGIAADIGAPEATAVAALGDEPETDDAPELGLGLSTAEMLQPGGFRRDFVFRKIAAAAAGADPATASDASSLYSNGGTAMPLHANANANANASGVSLASAASGPGGAAALYAPRARPTRSFIDFLSLYGHFGGEDLEEIEEEDEEDEEDEDEEAALEGDGARAGPGAPRAAGGGGGEASERTPLIRARSSVRGVESRKRMMSGARAKEGDRGPQGDASVTQAVMMLLKSFVGTGVLFLGKAFYNGGILFSVIVLCFIAMVSLFSFLLLVETRQVVPGSFGDIGGQLYGKWMRWAILTSIVLSQIGFVAAYTIFVSQNLQAFFMAVTNCRTYISVPYLIMAQLVIFLPLALIRNIQKLSGTALVADAFILIGLIYIFGNEIKVLVDHGAADVALFNKKDFPLLIGTAVFAFEGIGLVLPVYESMREPHKFPRVLSGVMVGSMVLFASGGVLAYLAYGSDIQTVVFINLPQDDKFVSASQFLYSIAILLSTPLQLFPAVRIMENGIFTPAKSGKRSLKVKWEKNMFRTLAVVGCSILAWAGAKDLDKFVSLIGSVACVPLGFAFPPLLHLKACAHTRRQKAIDIALLTFGLVAAVFSSSQTIKMFASGGEGAGPTFGKCPPPA